MDNSVRPSERKKGYATEILKQICFVARKHGMKQLQLSVEKNNVASIKTIEKTVEIIVEALPLKTRKHMYI